MANQFTNLSTRELSAMSSNPAQSSNPQFLAEIGRRGFSPLGGGQFERVGADPTQSSGSRTVGSEAIADLLRGAPKRTTRQDELSTIRQEAQLSSDERAKIQANVEALFAPRVRRQQLINESQQELFKARAAQRAGGTFGAGEREATGLGNVKQEAQDRLNELHGLQMAEASAREQGRITQNISSIQLADQLAARSDKALQQYFNNLITAEQNKRAQEKFELEQAAPLIEATAINLVGVDEDGTINPPTQEFISKAAADLGIDPNILSAAVRTKIDELEEQQAANRKAFVEEQKTKALTGKAQAETQQIADLAPFKLRKLQAEIAKALRAPTPDKPKVITIDQAIKLGDLTLVGKPVSDARGITIPTDVTFTDAIVDEKSTVGKIVSEQNPNLKTLIDEAGRLGADVQEFMNALDATGDFTFKVVGDTVEVIDTRGLNKSLGKIDKKTGDITK